MIAFLASEGAEFVTGAPFASTAIASIGCSPPTDSSHASFATLNWSMAFRSKRSFARMTRRLRHESREG